VNETLGHSLGVGQAWGDFREDFLAVKFNHLCFLFGQLPVHHNKRHKPLTSAQEVFHFTGQLHADTLLMVPTRKEDFVLVSLGSP